MYNAIIMAAGKGTRMKSDLPKVLHRILDVPMVELVLESLKKAGADRCITIVGYQGEIVENYLKGQCEFAYQNEQLGTGHAVMQVHQLEEEDGITVVASGDCPCVSSQTYEAMFHALDNGGDMAILTTIPDDNGAYGRIVRRDDGTVEKIVEFKDASAEEKAIKEINTGIYVFKNKVLYEGLKQLKNNNAQNEYYLTDLVEIVQTMGKTVLALTCEDWHEVEGINDKLALASANAYMQDKINRKHMLDGVTIYDPKTTYIGPYVTIGKNVTLYPCVQIYGHQHIADGMTIKANTPSE